MSANLLPSPPQPDPLPLYHRLYVLLRQRIQEGEYAADKPIPGEHELADAHGVSRITVRRALERLEQEGMVVRRRGAGTYAQKPLRAPQRESLRGLIDNLLAMGLRTKVKLVDFGYSAASPAAAAALDVPIGTIAQKSVRVRSVPNSKVPFSYLTTWVPEAIGRTYTARDLATKPLLQLLEDAGEPPVSMDQVISAKLADSDVAPLLEIEQGSALLWVRRRVRNADGRVIEAIEALYRPELYEYMLNLVRQDGVWSPSKDNW